MATQSKDYYGALGVKKTASTEEIRKAFRKLSRLAGVSEAGARWRNPERGA